MQVPLEWKLSVTGNNQVKSVMSDLNSAFERGQISGSDYADSMSKVGREANKVNNISRYQNQIFLSMHPNINKLSRAFSTFASVGRTALSIMTAFNTLLIATNTKSSSLVEEENKLADAMRGMARSIPGSEEWQEFNEAINVANARIKELKDQDFNTTLQTWLQPLFDIGIILGLFKNHLGSIAKILSGGGFAVMGGIFTAIALAVAFAAEEMYKFLFGVTDMDKWRAENVQKLLNFFTIDIPNAIGQAGVFLTNFFLNDLPNWAASGWKTVSDIFVKTWNDLMGFIEVGINFAIKAFSDFVNKIIAGFNAIIKGINKIPGFNIPLIPQFKLEGIKIPKIGDGGTGANPSGGTIGPSNTYITVQGSVLSEKELKSFMDSTFKQWMKDRGFTGYQ